MAGSYTRTVWNKNFGTVSSSYSCKAESIWQYLKEIEKIFAKCLCNLNQQDMQVEGCKLTQSLSHSPPKRETEKKPIAKDSDLITWLHRRAGSVNSRTIKFQNCVQYLERNHIFYL